MANTAGDLRPAVAHNRRILIQRLPEPTLPGARESPRCSLDASRRNCRLASHVSTEPDLGRVLLRRAKARVKIILKLVAPS
jgi:hypothetical protein